MARKIVVVEAPRVQRIGALPDLGLAIRSARTKSDLRIDTAASLCDVSVSLLSALENGTGRSTRLDKLLSVLDGMGLAMLVTTKENAERIQREMNDDART